VASRVLIAEDEAIIRLDLKEMLEEEGFDVVGEASDGDAAIRLARERNPDLVIMDIKMPGLDGLSAAERIVSESLAAVLILTAFSQRDLVQRAAQAGAIGYLVKPFQKSDLVPAIEVALARHQELVAVKKESADLNEQLQTRKLVDRAKGRLMDEEGLSEADAFRRIQKTAMNERRSMRAVAERLLGLEESTSP
jgi:two-component system, response regulator PdtaR